MKEYTNWVKVSWAFWMIVSFWFEKGAQKPSLALQVKCETDTCSRIFEVVDSAGEGSKTGSRGAIDAVTAGSAIRNSVWADCCPGQEFCRFKTQRRDLIGPAGLKYNFGDSCFIIRHNWSCTFSILIIQNGLIKPIVVLYPRCLGNESYVGNKMMQPGLPGKKIWAARGCLKFSFCPFWRSLKFLIVNTDQSLQP